MPLATGAHPSTSAPKPVEGPPLELTSRFTSPAQEIGRLLDCVLVPTRESVSQIEHATLARIQQLECSLNGLGSDGNLACGSIMATSYNV